MTAGLKEPRAGVLLTEQLVWCLVQQWLTSRD